MKNVILTILIAVGCACCDTQRPITANPDKQTTTSGTVGSAKMTNTLPETPDSTQGTPDSLQQRP